MYFYSVRPSSICSRDHIKSNFGCTAEKKKKQFNKMASLLSLFSSALPAPRGPYKVGTCEQIWISPNRCATQQRDCTDWDEYHKQRLQTHMKAGVKVKIWFPVDPKHARGKPNAKYIAEEMIPFVKKLDMDQLPEAIVRVLFNVSTHSVETTNILDGRWPGKSCSCTF